MASSASFIDYLKPYAQAMETKYGIDWRVIIAQAAQETGWGEHPHGYNLWGYEVYRTSWRRKWLCFYLMTSGKL